MIANVLIYVPMLVLLAFLFVHVFAVCHDYLTAIGSPLEIDYGEGIVWQQAALIPGPSMYSPSQALPFIVFHYPPIFHLLARAMLLFMPNFLAAGRAVSAVASLSIAVSAASLVIVATRRAGRKLKRTDIISAAIGGMLLLCLHVVHVWGMVMRVDAAAIAFAVGGLLVGGQGNGKVLPTTAGLFLCLCAVFTKQTQVSAGVALFTLTLLRAPRNALIAGSIVGGFGVAVTAVLQWATNGGFLLNIVGYNLNRFSMESFLTTYSYERSSLLVALAALVSVLIVIASIRPHARLNLRSPSELRIWMVSGITDRFMACRALLVLYLMLCTLTLVTTFKSGGGFNYLFEWLVAGSILVGVAVADLARKATAGGSSAGLIALLTPIIVTLVLLPTRLTGFLHDPDALAIRANLVSRISAATKPVASDNMTLLMQASKRVIYESAIVTELAELGRWDETPLVTLIKSRGFAFIVTTGTPQIQASRRTVAVKAAIDSAYPRVEQVGPAMWLNLPPL